MKTYEIYLNGVLVSTNKLEGLAFLEYESACLLGRGSIVKVDSHLDPVLGGRYKYDPIIGGWEYAGKA